MKKFVLLMVFILLVACSASAVYAVGLPDDPTEYAMDGISVSSDNFSNVFSGNPNTRAVIREDTLSDSELLLTNIVMDEESVSVTASVIINDTIVELPINGILGASYKTQSGINSAIVQVYGAVNGYEVLLFEIFNDTADDNLLLEYAGVGSGHNGTPHIKLYLKDSSGTIYIFESELPDAFIGINASVYTRAAKEKDALWAYPYVLHNPKEMNTTSQIIGGYNTSTARGANDFERWTHPTTYYDAYYIGSDYMEHYSVPYVDYEYVNVTSQDSTWIASLRVLERTEVTNSTNTTYTYYGTNPFEYYDPIISFACGDKSTFVRTYREGRVIDYDRFWFWQPELYENGMDIAISVLENTLDISEDILPFGTTFSTALTFIRAADSSSETVFLGSNGTNLSSGLTISVGDDLTGYYLTDCTVQGNSNEAGHYFTFHGVLSYRNIPGFTSTVGAMEVSFEVFNPSADSFTPVTKTFRIDYTSTQ